MLNNLNTIPLVKNRGVYWLPTKFLEQQAAGGTANPAGGTAGTSASGTAGCLGALKAAVKTVPGKLLEEEEGAAQPSGEGMASGSSGSGSGSSSVPVVVDIEIPRGDAQVSNLKKVENPEPRRSQKTFHLKSFMHTCSHTSQCVHGATTVLKVSQGKMTTNLAWRAKTHTKFQEYAWTTVFWSCCQRN